MPEGITCIVPVHDGATYLAAAIDSILAQEHRPLEVIVVDDGSTDGSRAIAEGYGDPVRVISQENRGCAAARNTGVRHARYDLVAFLDADDLYVPGRLDRQLAHLRSRPGIDISLCTAENFWEPGLEEEQRRYEAAGRLRATHHFGTMLASKTVFERIGPIDEQRRVGDQIEWFLRAKDAGLVIEVLTDVLMLRRNHAASMSHQEPSLEPFLDLAFERLATRRAR